MTRALTWLVAYAVLALLLGLLAKTLMSALDRTFAPPAQPLPLVHAGDRDRGGMIVCQPVVGPKPGTRSTPREIV